MPRPVVHWHLVFLSLFKNGIVYLICLTSERLMRDLSSYTPCILNFVYLFNIFIFYIFLSNVVLYAYIM